MKAVPIRVVVVVLWGAVLASAAGAVYFMDGATKLATVSVNAQQGTATFSTSALVVGSHNIKAVFAGSTYWKSSSSSVLVQSITH